MYAVISEGRLVTASNDILTKEIEAQYASTDEVSYMVVDLEHTTIEEILLQNLVPIVIMDILQRTRKENGLQAFGAEALGNINVVLAHFAYLNYHAAAINIPDAMQTQLITFIADYEGWKDDLMQLLSECDDEVVNDSFPDIMKDCEHYVNLIQVMRGYTDNPVTPDEKPIIVAYVDDEDEDTYGDTEFSDSLPPDGVTIN